MTQEPTPGAPKCSEIPIEDIAGRPVIEGATATRHISIAESGLLHRKGHQQGLSLADQRPRGGLFELERKL